MAEDDAGSSDGTEDELADDVPASDADDLLTVTMPVDEPATFEPIVPLPVVEPKRRPSTQAYLWAFLGALLLAGGLLVTAVIHADVSSIADEGWRSDALWSAAVAVVLLGLALAGIVWTAGSERRGPGVARTFVLASVVVVVAAVIVIAAADENGGHIATSSPITVPETEAADDADQPVSLADAQDPEQLAETALPIAERTGVSIALTGEGRALFAVAMGCRPADFAGNGLVGTAIGGTWTQPLLQVSPPFNENGREVARCTATLLRLPLEAGSIRPL